MADRDEIILTVIGYFHPLACALGQWLIRQNFQEYQTAGCD